MAEPEIKVSKHTFDQIEYAIERVLNNDISATLNGSPAGGDVVSAINTRFQNIEQAFADEDGASATIGRVNVTDAEGNPVKKGLSKAVNELYKAGLDRGWFDDADPEAPDAGDGSSGTIISPTEKIQRLMDEVGIAVDTSNENQVLIEVDKVNDEETLISKVNRLTNEVFAERGTQGILTGEKFEEKKVLTKNTYGIEDAPENDGNNYFTYEKIKISSGFKYNITFNDQSKLYRIWFLTENNGNIQPYSSADSIQGNVIIPPSNEINYISISFYGQNISANSVVITKIEKDIFETFCTDANLIVPAGPDNEGTILGPENGGFTGTQQLTSDDLESSNFLINLKTAHWVRGYILNSSENYVLSKFTAENNIEYGFTLLNYPAEAGETYTFTVKTGQAKGIRVYFLKQDGEGKFTKNGSISLGRTKKFTTPAGTKAFSISFAPEIVDFSNFSAYSEGSYSSLQEQIDNIKNQVIHGVTYSSLGGVEEKKIGEPSIQSIPLLTENSFYTKFDKNYFYGSSNTSSKNDDYVANMAGSACTINQDGYYLLSGSIGIQLPNTGDSANGYIVLADKNLLVQRIKFDPETPDTTKFDLERITNNRREGLQAGERSIIQAKALGSNEKNRIVSLPSKIVKLKKGDVIYLKAQGTGSNGQEIIVENSFGDQTFLTLLKINGINYNTEATPVLTIDFSPANEMGGFEWFKYWNYGSQVRFSFTADGKTITDIQSSVMDQLTGYGPQLFSSEQNFYYGQEIQYKVEIPGFYSVTGTWYLMDDNNKINLPMALFISPEEKYETNDYNPAGQMKRLIAKIKTNQVVSDSLPASVKIAVKKENGAEDPLIIYQKNDVSINTDEAIEIRIHADMAAKIEEYVFDATIMFNGNSYPFTEFKWPNNASYIFDLDANQESSADEPTT